jgi:hypothetical protein
MDRDVNNPGDELLVFNQSGGMAVYDWNPAKGKKGEWILL